MTWQVEYDGRVQLPHTAKECWTRRRFWRAFYLGRVYYHGTDCPMLGEPRDDHDYAFDGSGAA